MRRKNHLLDSYKEKGQFHIYLNKKRLTVYPMIERSCMVMASKQRIDSYSDLSLKNVWTGHTTRLNKPELMAVYNSLMP